MIDHLPQLLPRRPKSNAVPIRLRERTSKIGRSPEPIALGMSPCTFIKHEPPKSNLTMIVNLISTFHIQKRVFGIYSPVDNRLHIEQPHDWRGNQILHVGRGDTQCHQVRELKHMNHLPDDLWREPFEQRGLSSQARFGEETSQRDRRIVESLPSAPVPAPHMAMAVRIVCSWRGGVGLELGDIVCRRLTWTIGRLGWGLDLDSEQGAALTAGG